MSSNSSSRTTWFYRPNHYDQSKPYLNGLCRRPDLRVRTPSLRVHITCQRAWINSGDQIRPEPPILAIYQLKVKDKHRKAKRFADVAGPKTGPDYHGGSSPIIFRRRGKKSTAETIVYPTEPTPLPGLRETLSRPELLPRLPAVCRYLVPQRRDGGLL
jgi:hypothetical protein